MDLRTNGDGTTVAFTNYYTEVATGLNYARDGQRVPSSEDIEILGDGSAAATNGQHQAYFPADISSGVVTLVTPDAKRLSSRPLGLSYFDGTNWAMVALLTNSIGAVVTNSVGVVVYDQAFNGVHADLIYRYTKAGFEQDVVLKEQLPEPEDFGLDPQFTRLQITTEFSSPPTPSVITNVLPPQAGLQLTDQTLDFGVMKFIPGRAFLLGTNPGPVFVAKTWTTVNGAPCLIEEIPYATIAMALRTLPRRDALLNRRRRPHSSRGRMDWPRQREVKARRKERAFQTARLSVPRGFVMDYVTVNSSVTNYTFQGDTSYYISSEVYLSGATTFEGGAVLKYATNSSLYLSEGSTVNSLATDYRPTIFTAKDDNSVGVAISGSTGIPSGYYANPALIGYSVNFDLSHFRIAYAGQALSINEADTVFFDGQFINCSNGVFLGEGGAALRNCLFANFVTAFNQPADGTIDAQNVTFDGVSPTLDRFVATTITNHPFNLLLTNCVFVNLTGLTNGIGATISADFNGFYNDFFSPIGGDTVTSPGFPFKSLGAGDYYLTNGCLFRGAGTINVDSNLLADLATKTTYAPTVESNLTIGSGTVWNPTAFRDANGGALDMGYHYDSLDYLCSQITVVPGSPLTLSNGVAVALFGSTGFNLDNSAAFYSGGYFDAVNELVWYPSVQEQPVRLNNVSTVNSAIFSLAASFSPKPITMGFTDLAMQGQPQYFYAVAYPGYFPELFLENCHLRGVNLSVYGEIGSSAPSYGPSVTLQNNLLERSLVNLFNGAALYYYASNEYNIYQNPLAVTFYNNLFWNSTIDLDYYASQATYDPNWVICDNLYDTSSIGFGTTGTYGSYVQISNDAFYNTSNTLGGSNQIIITNLTYMPGPLSVWYIGSNSPTLADQGSRTAGTAGLTNYTLFAPFTNVDSNAEVPDTGIVDIGFHQLALNSSGTSITGLCEDVNFWTTCLSEASETFIPQFITNSQIGSVISNSVQPNSIWGFMGGISLNCGLWGSNVQSYDSTVVTNWNILYWHGNQVTNTNSLFSSFTPTNSGVGTNIFYLTYTNPPPCAETVTISITNIFSVAEWMASFGAFLGDQWGPGIDASPALSPDGTKVYFSSTADALYSLYASNGSVYWSNILTTAGGEMTSSSAVDSSGQVYAGTTDGFIDSFSPAGTTNWILELGPPEEVGVYATAALGLNDTVYVGTDEGAGAEFSPESGFSSINSVSPPRTNWFFGPEDLFYDNSGDVESSAAIGTDCTVYFLAEGSRLYAVSPSGNVLWFLPVPGHTEPDSSPSIGSDGVIYSGSQSPYVYAINPDGSLKWACHIPGVDPGSSPANIYSTPVIDSHNNVYVGSGYLYDHFSESANYYESPGGIFAITNGSLAWAYTNVPGWVVGTPVLGSNGTVYVGTASTNHSFGMLYALTNGVPQWTFRAGGDIICSPVICSNGEIIFSCEDGNVYKVSAPSSVAPTTLATSSWPMFHHDPQHTGSLGGLNCTSGGCVVPFPYDGTLDTNIGTFTFTNIGPAGTTWQVYSSTNLSNWVNSGGTVTLTNFGTADTNNKINLLGWFTDTNVANVPCKFYYLSNNGCCSKVIGFVQFGVAQGTNLIADPFYQVDDLALKDTFYNLAEVDTPPFFFSPMNSVAALFCGGNAYTVAPLPALGSNATISISTAQGNVIDISNGNGTWNPNGDIILKPGVGATANFPSSQPVWFIGLVRETITNNIPAGTNCLGSALPAAGRLKSDLNYTNASVGDQVWLWSTNSQSFVTYTNQAGIGWSTNGSTTTEPYIGLAEGFVMVSTNAHTWVQRFSPCSD
ncbi:MAG TPA: PQQ-binding-like beta-propeller repeat protein [Verrucomicrobiae bacterium]|nr:PQQ-binding-like beta-propeller repeat protein [Verrucomicrobiae bacterium]